MGNLNPITDLRNTSGNDLIARLHAIRETVAQRPPQHSLSDSSLSKQDNVTPALQEVKQLEIWAEAVRGVPNTLLRSSLFTVSKERDVFKKRELLDSTADVEIRFMGVRFNQTDLDVWEMLLHLARLQPLGSKVQFTAYSMLKELGRGTGKFQYEQLKEEIARLQGGHIEVTWQQRKTFLGSLIKEGNRNEDTQLYEVILDERLLLLYDCGYSHINWEQRKALKSSLAQWLHGMYSGHAVPYPYKVETIHRLCGSRTKQPRNFRQMLKVALDELVNVGAIKSWDIDATDLVRVVAIPSDSQAKHINKKCHTRGRKPSTFSRIGNYAARGKIT